MLYFTREQVQRWAGPLQYRDGAKYFEQGQARDIATDGDWIVATIAYGERTIQTRFRVLRDSTVDSLCPCRDRRERGLICAHVVAAGLAFADEISDPKLDRETRIAKRRERERMSGPAAGYLRRMPAKMAAVIPAKLELGLSQDWRETIAQGFVVISAHVIAPRGRERIDRVGTHPWFTWSAHDENLLYLLEDMMRGPLPGRMQLPLEGFLHLLFVLAPGELLVGEGNGKVRVGDRKIIPLLRISLDAATGELVLDHVIEDMRDPLVLATRRVAWVFNDGEFMALEQVLPPAFQAAYRAPLRILRDRVPAFFRKELPALEQKFLVDCRAKMDDLAFTIGDPSFRLLLRGSPDQLVATLYADYGGVEGPVAARGFPDTTFLVPNPKNPSGFLTRNEPVEKAGLEMLAKFGLKGETGDRLNTIDGARDVMDFLGRVVPAVKADGGYRIEFAGELEAVSQGARWLEPQISVSAAGAGWFEVKFDCEDGAGGSVSVDEIDAALRAGSSHLERNGKTLLLDRETMSAVTEMLDDGDAITERKWKISEANAGYLMALLGSLHGVTVNADATVEEAAKQQNRQAVAPKVEFPADLDRILRDYQKDGVRWMRFLEGGGFCGILADDMGLGKTVQALAWMQLARLNKNCVGLPCLVVCPTSLIENWAMESSRFTPGLKVLVVSGAERHKVWDEVPDAGIVITSYALLRRDIDQYRQYEFAAAVLDEAQHIKNHSTLNAKAAKSIHAFHRLVLTGTPIENSVADLWSIMDYLMPGYLGSYNRFRGTYELPIANAGRDGQLAQSRLRKKCHPFMLRRLKSEVASELPPRLERIAYCTMSADQRAVYQRVLAQAQAEVSGLVSKQGFARSRFAVLKTLTKLRQICCHLDLLRLPDFKPDEPSGKLDLFLELLEEAMDGGHRVLVFSQFVSMLAILRRELDSRQIPYCYLDGSTKDRIGQVTTFNRDATIPAFLISLKAGGTGLNLTGADMVIHFDPWWNPAVEDQATDRAHRIGQEKTVYAIKLITRESVEEKVLELQQRKRKVIEAALAREEIAIDTMTWEDVRSLLSL